MFRRTTRALGATLITATLALALTACGADEDDGASQELSATEHNEADVAFASDMLQHHAQALSMVDLTLDRPLSPEVQQLADQIRTAQAGEIELFADWLTDWDEEVPATVRDHANAGHDMDDMDHSEGMDGMEGMDSDMPGMMSGAEMSALQDAPDAEFETLWLEMMIEHHTGAIEMAEAEQEDGRYEPAVTLAGEIVELQAAEIATMEELLGS
jgi:uncharacterized protein (DUF305 family)